jgi:purine-binding chemotaxis protein CheW
MRVAFCGDKRMVKGRYPVGTLNDFAVLRHDGFRYGRFSRRDSQMETMLATQSEKAVHASAGKYLTFVLGHEEYGLEILRVREIMGIVPITHLPQMPLFIKGVINLRGAVIPIVDLRLKFGMPEIEYTKETCIIVMDIAGKLTGIVVDSVSEVLDITEKEIDDAPSFGSSVDTEFIIGMGKVKGKVKILLDIAKALEGETHIIAQAALTHPDIVGEPAGEAEMH